MEYRHEIIQFSNQIPGKIFLHRLGSVPRHWHKSLEVLFVLSGTVTVRVDDRCYELRETDLLVINSLSPHELYSDSVELLAFQSNSSNAVFSDILKECYFSCCSAGDTENPRYYRLRQLLAKLVKENSSGENLLMSYSLIAQLLYELQQSFSAPMPESMDIKRKALTQMAQITDYILKHYRDRLSLQDVAAHFHYSASYLSRFFNQNLNMTFLDFYTSIRLESAVHDLITGKESISEIASGNGFSSSRSFTVAFQKKYGVLPSEYRQNHSSITPLEKCKTEVNYLAVTNTRSLSVLAGYLNDPPSPEAKQQRYEVYGCGAVSARKKSRELTHNWRSICCVGSSRELLYEDVRQMLRKAQAEIGYRYIKFHGVLSDDLMLYDELADGSVHLSFVLFDQVMDFLMSIGLRPWMQLSFMPRALASNPGRNSFFLQQNCSLPKDMEKWTSLIRELVLHCIRRYSLEEVLSWPFCVWNEPDTTEEMFGFGDKQDFFRFYQATYKTLKSVHPGIQVGSPSLLFLLDDPLDWYGPFFDYCRKNQCVPDFFTLHYYSDDITLTSNSGNSASREQLINRLNPNPDAFRLYLDELNRKRADFGVEKLPVYLAEWNLTVSHRNLLNDTCFKACYLTKNLLENYDRLQSFGYWSLTDLIGESQLPQQIFHGGLGMFTYNQIPKAHYYAFRVLTKLEDILVDAGEGWFLTRARDKERLVLALYNYTHFNRLISAGELFDMTPTERYTGFAGLSHRQFTLDIGELSCPEYVLKHTFINRQHGSSYDCWVEMGGSDTLCEEEISHLRAVSQPGMLRTTAAAKHGTLTIQCILEPLEVRLIEIVPAGSTALQTGRNEEQP